MGGQEGSTETVRVELGDGAGEQDFLARCVRAAQLSGHPHLATPHDHGLAADGMGYAVTDSPPGRSLAEGLSRDGAFALAASLRIGVALAGALQTLHQAGVVHGAVSPGNVFLGPAREPVLANLVRAEVSPPATDGQVTERNARSEDSRADALEHAPPEVRHGGQGTPAADVFSLASTIYTMVAGRTPDAARVLFAAGAGSVAEGDPAAGTLPPIGGKVPVELEDALAKALVPDPAVRTATASAFADALQEVQRQLRHPVTELVVIEVQEPELAPDGTAYTYAEPPEVGGVAAPKEATAWWRSPAVYLGAAAAVALVAGVALLLGGGGGGDSGEADEPERALPQGLDDATKTTPQDSSGDHGDEGEAAGSDRDEPSEEPGDGPDEPGADLEAEPEDAGPPGNLTVLENAVGVQLDWEGDQDARYVILVSSDSEEPRFVPATGGPSHLVPTDLLLPGVGYCFAVAYLDDATSNPADAGDDSAFSDPACIRDADA